MWRKRKSSLFASIFHQTTVASKTNIVHVNFHNSIFSRLHQKSTTKLMGIYWATQEVINCFMYDRSIAGEAQMKWSLSWTILSKKEDLLGFTCIPNEQFSICSLCKKPFSLWATNVGLKANLSLHHMPSQPSSVCSQTRYQPISVTKGYLFASFKV